MVAAMEPDQELDFGVSGFESIVGHGSVIERLERAIDTGRVHHAYYFTGPEGVGKAALGVALAQALNCADEDCMGHPDCGGTANTCQAEQDLWCWSFVSGSNNAPGSTDVVEDYACGIGGETGPEYTYHFEMTEFGNVTVNLSGLSADLDLFVLTADGQQCDPDNCQEQSVAGGSSGESIQFFAFPGQTFYVVVDGYGGNVSGFDLEVLCGGGMP